MVRTLYAFLAAAGAAAALAGCAEEPLPAISPSVYPEMEAAELSTIGTPGPPDVAFGQGLVAYSRDLSDLHATDANAGERIQGQVLALADILERLPAAAAEPGLRRAAGHIRAAASGESLSMEDTKRALAVAAAALLGAAKCEYRGRPEIVAHARAFAGWVSAIDSSRDPPDYPTVIAALLRAEHTLAAMYVANVGPPRSR
jgi:hypothetical protein